MGHFHYNGPLPADSKLFVGRQAELRQVREICTGPLRSYVTLVGASQTGKTSFLYRLRKELPSHCPSVLVNLQMVPEATPAALFRFVATEIASQLGLPAVLATAAAISSGTEFEQWLRGLPAIPFDSDEILSVGVTPHARVHYDGNRYSVPPTLVR
jgi:hypothetical protein